MHGEIGEEDDEVVFDPDDESRVTFVLSVDDLHVIAHVEVLFQLVGGEFQRFLSSVISGNPCNMGQNNQESR